MHNQSRPHHLCPRFPTTVNHPPQRMHTLQRAFWNTLRIELHTECRPPQMLPRPHPSVLPGHCLSAPLLLGSCWDQCVNRKPSFNHCKVLLDYKNEINLGLQGLLQDKHDCLEVLNNAEPVFTTWADYIHSRPGENPRLQISGV